MKRLFAIAVSSLFVLTGCAAEPEFGEVSSAIQDSQEMQSEGKAETSQETSSQDDSDEGEPASDDGSTDTANSVEAVEEEGANDPFSLGGG